MRRTEQRYAGLDAELAKGLSPTAKIVLDARVFGFIADDETCKGWPLGRLQALYDQVSRKWDDYAHLPSRLPEDLRTRHSEIYAAAIKTARAQGWDPNAEIRNEERNDDIVD